MTRDTAQLTVGLVALVIGLLCFAAPLIFYDGTHCECRCEVRP